MKKITTNKKFTSPIRWWLLSAVILIGITTTKLNAQCAGTYTITISTCGFWDESHFEIRNAANVSVFQSAATGSFSYTASGIAPNNGPFTIFLETQGFFNDNCANWSVTGSGVSLSGTITGGLTFTSAQFCSTQPPTVTSFTPNSGCVNTTSVVITGTEFTGVTAVSFGGTNALNYVVNSTTQITATVGSGTTGTVQIITAGGTGTSAGTFTVNPLPIVGANPTATTLCAGDLLALFGSGASNYTWNNGVTNGVAFAALATTTYIVSVTDGNGCANTASTTVTVNQLPIVAANASASAVCIGDMETLTGSGANSYTWDNSVTDGVAFAPAATATYMVTGTDGNGCINTATTTVTVNSLPAVSANASAAAVCMGDMETLTGSGASSYTWDNSVTDGVAFAPAATATYMVTGTDGNGCINSATTTVTVNTLPAVSANASAATVCAGDMETLTGSGANSYTWNNGVTDGVAFATSGTTTYMVTGTDGNGCMNTATTTVNVNPLPAVSANASASSVCIGDTETLTGGGASSYTWDNSVTDGVTFTPAATATYMVTGTDGNGCVNTATTTVTVNSLPTITINAINPICIGDMETLSGVGAASYVWDNGVTDGVAFAATSTNTYMVTGTDGNGCVNTASTTVTVNLLPIVSANSSNGTLCEGTTETLTGSGAASYTWDNGVTDGVAFAATTTTTYMVTGTDVNGCMNTATVTVNVNPLPTVGANATANSLCTGGSVTLTGSGASVYSWDNSVTDGVAFTPANTNTYTVMGMDGNGCTNTASATVTVNSLPNVTYSETMTMACVNWAAYALAAGSPANGVYSGMGVMGTSFDPAMAGAGTYYVTYTFTDANGCTSADSSAITVDACTGIQNLTNASALTVYPNPNNGQFTITADAEGVYTIVNQLGQTIKSVQLNAANNYTMNLDGISNGIYFITGINGNKVVRQKVVVTR